MLRSSSHSNLPGAPIGLPKNPRLSSSGGALAMSGVSVDSVELQKVLTEERMRSDQHRTNYQLLKVEHNKLQDSCGRLENDLARATAEIKNLLELHRREAQENQKILNELQKENTSLRANQITEERLERIKMEVNEELDELYQERYNRLQAEAASSRAECNRYRYENTFFKSEMEHLQSDHKRMMEELTLMHEAEVGNLRLERDQLLSATMKTDEGGKLKSLYRENSQLHMQIKSLKGELEEAVTSKVHTLHELDLTNRNQVKEINTLRSNVRQLEAEKFSLKHELEEVSRDLNQIRTESQTYIDKLHQAQRDLNQQKHRYEELGHKAHIDLTQLKLEASKQRGEIERQRDVLAGKLEELEYQLQLAQNKCLQMEKSMEDREKELTDRENAYREEERQKIMLVERERALLEEKVTDLQRTVRDQEPNFSLKMERMQESVQHSDQAKAKAESELLNAQRRADKMDSKYQLSQRTVADLEDKVARLDREVEEYHSQLKAATENLGRKKILEEEVDHLKKLLSQNEAQSRQTFERSESEWRNHQKEMTKRIRELEEQANNVQSQYCTMQDQQRQKKKKYSAFFHKQRNRIELLEARVSELSTENDILKSNVTHEEYAKVKKELKDMKRRHQQFKAIIAGAPAATRMDPAALPSEEEFRVIEELKILRSGQEESQQRQKEIASYFGEFLKQQEQSSSKISVDDCDILSHIH